MTTLGMYLLIYDELFKVGIHTNRTVHYMQVDDATVHHFFPSPPHTLTQSEQSSDDNGFTPRSHWVQE